MRGCWCSAPDGCLYASAGDNTHPFGDSQSYAPLDRRPGREPWNAEKSAGNPNDLRGGIIRIRPMPDGDYEIPEGNLFPPGTPGTRPEIYVMGCRNPWKISIDPATGYLYWGEVGPDAGGDGPARPARIRRDQPGAQGWVFWMALLHRRQPGLCHGRLRERGGRSEVRSSQADQRQPAQHGSESTPAGTARVSLLAVRCLREVPRTRGRWTRPPVPARCSTTRRASRRAVGSRNSTTSASSSGIGSDPSSNGRVSTRIPTSLASRSS